MSSRVAPPCWVRRRGFATEFPRVEIVGFVLVRAMTDGEIVTIRDPRVGTIDLKDGESLRRP